MNIQAETVTINGIEYVRADQAQQPKPNGNRAVVVVDRGWIFAGDVTYEERYIRISRALHVFKWESVGFAGMIENTKKADLRPIRDVLVPHDAEIFCIPVDENWGLG